MDRGSSATLRDSNPSGTMKFTSRELWSKSIRDGQGRSYRVCRTLQIKADQVGTRSNSVLGLLT